MKKAWSAPEMKDMSIQATAYAPEQGSRVDGSYVSTDGKHTYFTYAPSGGSSGNNEPR